MGFKPIPTAKWKKWLKSLGLEYKRTEGSHEVWDYPDDSLLRPVVFRGPKKKFQDAIYIQIYRLWI